jgi:5-(carboxyamino)imidazole ribonucleotide mutase
MNKVVIIAGSESDAAHVDKIVMALQDCEYVVIYASAHREPLAVLKVLEDYKGSIFITVAGKSNALSGMVACNCKDIVIACPPFADLTAYMVDIHSTLRMPSKVPVLTVVDPINCALAVARILKRLDKA